MVQNDLEKNDYDVAEFSKEACIKFFDILHVSNSKALKEVEMYEKGIASCVLNYLCNRRFHYVINTGAPYHIEELPEENRVTYDFRCKPIFLPSDESWETIEKIKNNEYYNPRGLMACRGPAKWDFIYLPPEEGEDFFGGLKGKEKEPKELCQIYKKHILKCPLSSLNDNTSAMEIGDRQIDSFLIKKIEKSMPKKYRNRFDKITDERAVILKKYHEEGLKVFPFSKEHAQSKPMYH